VTSSMDLDDVLELNDALDFIAQTRADNAT
jgi:hypothetical protein